ncbi:hypothetical protein PTSG_06969 [Salpingoeca rosetta]|uniref:3-hydroxyisobutyryl-CoA hydrolase n=1 Tax=Salpingoeca rosetta (strain ATCC 50818 / BSB-021) TaxID=946362 RepID=F2UFB9_SALR5|nr:uncharacterized protein PTSG_06969 [Salpingoeca rosetta]EGD75319.1 hypothetical protein PTSG_06969 [Salpingoeca rosetta]|eukprot:XP_004992372.1 hypothetical protein PTSG_06969 [Salpingoeca rosetta]
MTMMALRSARTRTVAATAAALSRTSLAQQATRHLATSADESEDVLVEEQGHLRTLVLNRPKAHNALTYNMVKTICDKAEEWNNDNKVKVVAMRGAGAKAFCAGECLRRFFHAPGELEDDGQLARDFFHQEYQADYALATLAKPYVAFMDGFTMGGGVGVSVHGRFRVATEKTVFAMPETAIGLFPDVGGSYFLPRLSGGLGLYLALTGARLKGQDVLAAGIATHFVTSASIPEVEKALAGWCCDGKIDSIFMQPTLQEVFDALEADSSEWAKKQRETLAEMSPLSMMVTFEQLQRGKTMDLRRCLEMEYNISQHCVHGNDFYQGVRGKLMKGPPPEWKHKSIADVTRDEVEEFFQPTSRTLTL